MTTALYMRLSVADGDKQESESVTAQRDLLTDFVANHPDLSSSKVLTFVDDDYTGTNLNRPGFQRMLEQTKAGEINCIIVKDFSRFARSSVDTSEYLELIFPFLNVRFIAVINGYDSNSHKGATAGFEATVPALIAEMYSRDLSVKIKTAKAEKAKRGEFLGARPRYGYVKSIAVKNGLEIDPIAAEVIKRIFTMAADGIKPSQIAKTLNNESVDAPMTHFLKMNPGQNCYKAKRDRVYWTYENIRKYLRDEIYTGKLISGKKNRYELGSQKYMANPKEDWIVVSNAVPAIVTEDLFVKAQAVIKDTDRSAPHLRQKSVFAYKVLCGHCGCSLKRQSPGIYGCISSRYSGREKCLDGVIREEWLKSEVLAAYNKAVSDTLVHQDLMKRHEEQLKLNADSLKARRKKLHQSEQGLKDAKKALFEKYTTGSIGEAEYKSENAGLSRQLGVIGQSMTELDIEAGQFKSKPAGKGASQVASLNATAFSDRLMVYVKSIVVYGTNRADVDIDLSAVSTNL